METSVGKLSALEALEAGRTSVFRDDLAPPKPLVPEGHDNTDAFSDWAVDLAYWMQQIGKLDLSAVRR